jgi:hypothetical protein
MFFESNDTHPLNFLTSNVAPHADAEASLPNNNHNAARCISLLMRDSNMAYILPRAVLLLMAWGLTCVLIRKMAPDADATIFLGALASWLVGGAAYFGYLRKLRRDIAELERARGFSLGRKSV